MVFKIKKKKSVKAKEFFERLRRKPTQTVKLKINDEPVKLETFGELEKKPTSFLERHPAIKKTIADVVAFGKKTKEEFELAKKKAKELKEKAKEEKKKIGKILREGAKAVKGGAKIVRKGAREVSKFLEKGRKEQEREQREIDKGFRADERAFARQERDARQSSKENEKMLKDLYGQLRWTFMAKFRFKRRNGTVILSDSTVSEKKLNLFKKMK